MYLDKIMGPIVKILSSYVKDDKQALDIFRDLIFLPKQTSFHHGYYISLYFHSQWRRFPGLKHFFDQRTIKEPSSETLLRPAEPVLKLNCNSFGDNYYKQN